MTVGIEWLVDAEGCRPAALRDMQLLQRLCGQLVADLDLHTVGEPHWHQFPPPSGVTGMFLLTESHLACHTYPETGQATFNLYVCRGRPRWPWEARLRELLGAKHVRARSLQRGAGHDVAAAAREEGAA